MFELFSDKLNEKTLKQYIKDKTLDINDFMVRENFLNKIKNNKKDWKLVIDKKFVDIINKYNIVYVILPGLPNLVITDSSFNKDELKEKIKFQFKTNFINKLELYIRRKHIFNIIDIDNFFERLCKKGILINKFYFYNNSKYYININIDNIQIKEELTLKGINNLKGYIKYKNDNNKILSFLFNNKKNILKKVELINIQNIQNNLLKNFNFIYKVMFNEIPDNNKKVIKDIIENVKIKSIDFIKTNIDNIELNYFSTAFCIYNSFIENIEIKKVRLFKVVNSIGKNIIINNAKHANFIDNKILKNIIINYTDKLYFKYGNEKTFNKLFSIFINPTEDIIKKFIFKKIKKLNCFFTIEHVREITNIINIYFKYLENKDLHIKIFSNDKELRIEISNIINILLSNENVFKKLEAVFIEKKILLLNKELEIPEILKTSKKLGKINNITIKKINEL